MLQSPSSGTGCHPACLNIIHLLWQLNVYCCLKYTNNQQIPFNIYDAFYSRNSQQHVSASIPVILRGRSYTRIQKYKCG